MAKIDVFFYYWFGVFWAGTKQQNKSNEPEDILKSIMEEPALDVAAHEPYVPKPVTSPIVKKSMGYTAYAKQRYNRPLGYTPTTHSRYKENYYSPREHQPNRHEYRPRTRSRSPRRDYAPPPPPYQRKPRSRSRSPNRYVPPPPLPPLPPLSLPPTRIVQRVPANHTFVSASTNQCFREISPDPVEMHPRKITVGRPRPQESEQTEPEKDIPPPTKCSICDTSNGRRHACHALCWDYFQNSKCTRMQCHFRHTLDRDQVVSFRMVYGKNMILELTGRLVQEYSKISDSGDLLVCLDDGDLEVLRKMPIPLFEVRQYKNCIRIGRSSIHMLANP
jgi:hypothetical protein